jgi:hypothetical protein
MLPAVKGLVLGMANTIVIATANAIAAATHTEIGWSRTMKGSGSPDPGELFVLVTVLGVFPAMFAGLLIGWIAGRLKGTPIVRLLILAIPAVALVAFLGAATRSWNLIALSCIPTLAMTSILERWTRTPAPVPPARAA